MKKILLLLVCLVSFVVNAQTRYVDRDCDGYGSTTVYSPLTHMMYCYAYNNIDCNDNNAGIKPRNWYYDENGDGMVDGTESSILQCNRPSSEYFLLGDANFHWIQSAAYDVYGNTLSSSRTYYDELGRQNIALTKDYVQNKVWGQEVTYDDFGRTDKVSFPVTVPELGSTYDDFEKIGILTTSPTYPSTNNLSVYYSNGNIEEPYQATAYQPYSQVNYDKLNPGNTINIVGGNQIGGQWKTPYSYVVPAAQELYYFYGKDYFDGVVTDAGETVITKYYKVVNVDADGVETVTFVDGEGKVLAKALTGGTKYPVISLIGSEGYIDVHIPAGVSSTDISLIGGAANYSVYSLKDGALVTGSLTGGNGYRIKYNGVMISQPLSSDKTYITSGGTVTTEAMVVKYGINYKVNYYNFSLNVYNDTGELIKTIQPNGTSISTYVQGTPAYMQPTYTDFVTQYKYNNLGQIVQATSPDEGTVNYSYRKDGQIRYSQNSLQLGSKVTYVEYDSYGRAIESGILATSSLFSSLAPDSRLPLGSRSEQVFTVYDYTANTTSQNVPPPSFNTILSQAGLSAASYQQKNLSSRVAVTYSANGSSAILAATWYSYDSYGRLEWVVVWSPDLGAKTIHYYYDVWGNLSTLTYNKDNPNEIFAHSYTYDLNGALTKVQTGTSSFSIFTTHADYEYYQTGELKRVEYAGGVQGVDYVYTLGGLLKSINHPSLEAAKDPGGDNNDLFGVTLDYYAADYVRSGSNVVTSSSVSGYNTDSYSGNIKAVRFANRTLDFGSTTAQQKAYLYKYNTSGFLTDATYGTVSGTSTISPSTKYKEYGIGYDQNGNITSLKRSNEAGTTYDNLSYSYKSGKNQLDRVSDLAGTTSSISYDIEPQAANNYVYNAIGQLTRNEAEGLDYYYNSNGLVTEVRKNNATIVKFFYNEHGNRIKKESYNTSGSGALVSTDYYVSSPDGQVLAIYKKPLLGMLTLKEQPIYGLDRIGVYNRDIAVTNYELKDHLGNVRAVFQKQSSAPVMQSYADYYPFGEQLPARNSFSNYRYAFQGQELDAETGMEAFNLRLWDGRIGRWLSPDPQGQYFSPYLGMGNNPIGYIDADGGWAWKWWANIQRNKAIEAGLDPSELMQDGKGEWYFSTSKLTADFVDGSLVTGVNITPHYTSDSWKNSVGAEITLDIPTWRDDWANSDNLFASTSYDLSNSFWIFGQFMIGRGVGDYSMRNIDGSTTTTDEGVLGFSSLMPVGAGIKVGVPSFLRVVPKVTKFIPKFNILKDVGHKSLFVGYMRKFGLDLEKKYASGFLVTVRNRTFRFQAHRHTLSTLPGVKPGVKVPHINLDEGHFLLGKYRNNGSRWFNNGG